MKNGKIDKPMEIVVAAILTLFAVVAMLVAAAVALLGGIILALGVLTGLIFLLMNVLMPVIGVVYPLTVVQCFVVALIICVLRILLNKLFG